MGQNKTTRLAAVGDIHVKATHRGKWREYFEQVSEVADVLLLCGDLTDTGLKEEAEVLVEELKACTIPVLAVLGNHDYESNTPQDVINTIKDHMHFLDGDSIVIGNVGFAGIKGFGGGFDRYKMPAYGEEINKQFVQVVKDEAQKLDKALEEIDRLGENLKKVVVMHYAPIEHTVIGEPSQIHSYLGSSYLAEPLDKHMVDVAFHGHAHIGTLEGITPGGTRVFNVAVPILRNNGLKLPFYLMSL